MNHFASTYPALDGGVVTQGHADWCAEHGHAVHTVDGVDQERCPRCGELREPFSTYDLAYAEFVRIATAIGAGFHPDTPGRDYTSLPAGITPDDVDYINQVACEHGIDVYEVAMEIVAAEIAEWRVSGLACEVGPGGHDERVLYAPIVWSGVDSHVKTADVLGSVVAGQRRRRPGAAPGPDTADVIDYRDVIATRFGF